MILDGHVHVQPGAPDAESLLSRMRDAGVSGGILISLPPRCFTRSAASATERLENVAAWCCQGELYPFFWIDPTEQDAPAQVAMCVELGVAGFKVIPGRHEPCCSEAMRTYAAIAESARPILFHSGILWDGQPSSSHCRPASYEGLLEVPGLRFALAHVAWPWCDELIAVYGKFAMARRQRPELDVEMFIDVTPGTPPIYRREVLTKLFTVGYDVARNVIFGTDCNAVTYRAEWAREWIERDSAIYGDLGLGADVQDAVFAGNLRRFVDG